MDHPWKALTFRGCLRELYTQAGSPTADRLKEHADIQGHTVSRSALISATSDSGAGLRWTTVEAFIDACRSYALSRRRPLPPGTIDMSMWREMFEIDASKKRRKNAHPDQDNWSRRASISSTTDSPVAPGSDDGVDSLYYYCYISEAKVNQILAQSVNQAGLASFPEHKPGELTDSLLEFVSRRYGYLQSFGCPGLSIFSRADRGHHLVTKLRSAIAILGQELGDVPCINDEVALGRAIRATVYLCRSEFLVTHFDDKFAYLSTDLGPREELQLTCSLRYFSDSCREDGTFVPHSGNADFFAGKARPVLDSILYVLQARQDIVLGTPLYLGVRLDSGLQL
jgi:hypothetical protein